MYQPQSWEEEENEAAEHILRSVDIRHYCPLALASVSNSSGLLLPKP